MKTLYHIIVKTKYLCPGDCNAPKGNFIFCCTSSLKLKEKIEILKLSNNHKICEEDSFGSSEIGIVKNSKTLVINI